jgi:hypothetical protein
LSQELERIKIPSNRKYWIVFTFLGFNIIYCLQTGTMYTSIHYVTIPIYILGLILIVPFAMPSIPIICMGYREHKKLTLKNFYNEQMKHEIPNIDEIMNMKCILCNNKIDHPTNMLEHLGINQTKSYLKFCQSNEQTPQLYCCSCYSMIEKVPDWKKAYAEMVQNSIQAKELKKQYESKLDWIISEEHRLMK